MGVDPARRRQVLAAGRDRRPALDRRGAGPRSRARDRVSRAAAPAASRRDRTRKERERHRIQRRARLALRPDARRRRVAARQAEPPDRVRAARRRPSRAQRDRSRAQQGARPNLDRSGDARGGSRRVRADRARAPVVGAGRHDPPLPGLDGSRAGARRHLGETPGRELRRHPFLLQPVAAGIDSEVAGLRVDGGAGAARCDPRQPSLDVSAGGAR